MLAVLPKILSIGCMVNASNNSKDAFPLNSFSVKLDTLAVNTISSPSLKNLGALGCIINSFCVTTLSNNCALCISLVCANPIKFQVVNASGIVKVKAILPSASVSK